jgi:hypothetical protein
LEVGGKRADKENRPENRLAKGSGVMTFPGGCGRRPGGPFTARRAERAPHECPQDETQSDRPGSRVDRVVHNELEEGKRILKTDVETAVVKNGLQNRRG